MENPTRETAAVLFLDLQEEIVKNSRTLPVERLRRTAGALAKLAALHQLPAFLSAAPPGGAFLASVLQPLNHPQPRLRTQTTAFADRGLVDALLASGRRVLVLAGVASEIVVQRTALAALVRLARVDARDVPHRRRQRGDARRVPARLRADPRADRFLDLKHDRGRLSRHPPHPAPGKARLRLANPAQPSPPGRGRGKGEGVTGKRAIQVDRINTAAAIRRGGPAP